MHILQTPIEYLKGVGPSRSVLLKQELGIYNFQNLLTHFPFRYLDRSKVYCVNELNHEMSYVQISGVIIKIEEKGHKRSKRLVAHLKDSTGIIQLIWFKGIRWIKSTIRVNEKYIVFGKPNLYLNSFTIAHPELEIYNQDKLHNAGLYPVYRSTEKLNSKGLNSKALSKLIKNLLLHINDDFEENLSIEMIKNINLPSSKEAYTNIHFPSNNRDLIRASKRLKFEELFFLQLHLLKSKLIRNKHYRGYEFKNVSTGFNSFYKDFLPFPLTSAQKRVLKEIRNDTKKPVQMSRLLQGDVGSGKTLVAFLSMLLAYDNNYQSCLMAPTEILAQQHYTTLIDYVKNLSLNIGLLTGSTKTSDRKKIHADLENGSIDILIGTHALLEDKVKFKDLAFVVIDEQHRFGVAQRAKLWKKNTYPPHILVMTATPIPRTLSMTLYGDLSISVIDELPPGRKEIKTSWKTDSSRLSIFQFMRDQINEGRQIYVVFPLIKESEKLDYKDLMEGYDAIEKEFPLPKYQVSVVHGKMRAEDKEYEMKRFVEGVTDIMVATTVIEVGVNVPNASVMIIESAERFGLSQLHQLRGRVGRGAAQSYCILVSGNKTTNDARKRLKTMVDTNDGFKISEVDLEIRGPGDIMGTQQSGILDFKIANLITDNEILNYARKEAKNILEKDPDLSNVSNSNILKYYKKYSKDKKEWSRIG